MGVNSMVGCWTKTQRCLTSQWERQKAIGPGHKRRAGLNSAARNPGFDHAAFIVVPDESNSCKGTLTKKALPGFKPFRPNAVKQKQS